MDVSTALLCVPLVLCAPCSQSVPAMHVVVLPRRCNYYLYWWMSPWGFLEVVALGPAIQTCPMPTTPSPVLRRACCCWLEKLQHVRDASLFRQSQTPRFLLGTVRSSPCAGRLPVGGFEGFLVEVCWWQLQSQDLGFGRTEQTFL